MDALVSEARELTIEEAVSFAILLQKGGQLAEADQLYRLVLARIPDHPRALHFAGVLAHQQCCNEQAIALIEQSLALAPDHADWYSNLGIVYQPDGQPHQALNAYRRAIAIDPGHANAYNKLGVVLKAIGKPGDAEAAYRRAIQLDPNHTDAYTNLGILLNAVGRTEEAAACYCKAITLRPKHRQARKLLVLAHCTLGEIDEAVTILKQWLDEEPADPIARHMLAACTGCNVPARASSEFVEETFDSFAKSFESKLQKLSYRIPRLVASMVEDSGLEPGQRLDVLDAGCGTGLCGPLVAPFARRLTGVDLSAGMLRQAESKRLYDDLVRMELSDYLRCNRESFDLIVSADTLVYFGDLEDVFDAASGALRPNGVFVFTLEHAVRAEAGVDYRLEFHGRYSHTRAYVARGLARAGLLAEFTEAELRIESGAPVAGLVVRARKSKTGRTDCGES